MKIKIVFLILICILPVISADLFPTPTQTLNVGIGGGSGQTGVNIFIPDEIFNSSASDSNSTNFWTTLTFGTLQDVNATQFNNIANVLNIDPSWLESFGDGEWLALDGGNSPSAAIDWNNQNLDNVDNITIDNNIFFGDFNHFLRRGTLNFNGLGTNAFSFHQNVEHPEGTIPFIVSVNKSNSDNDAVLIMVQSGLNESNSILGNSWFIVVNNLTNNLTEYSKCFLVAGLLNETLRVQCDSGGSGADLIVQDDIQSFGTMFADGGIRAETLVDFVMNGSDVNIQGGGLHIFTPVTFEQGVVTGNEVTTFIEDFTGGLGSFTNLQTDLGNWFVTANILCDDGDCANSIGISGVGNIIMEANISTVNINTTSLNFIYSLTNILGSNDFEVTVNNNVGSGEVSILTDSTNNVVKSSQSIALPSSMSNQPVVSIRFNCDVTNTNRQCFVDTINVNGTAIATTLTNVSSFDSVIKFGEGTLAADGFPERGIIYNASGDEIIFRGNVTFENIIEQDLEITNSITLNGTTIFDWAGVVTSLSFPKYFLTNGSSVMLGSMNLGGFDLFNVNDINGSGNFTTTGNMTASFFVGDGSLLTGISSGGDNESWNQTFADTLYADISIASGINGTNGTDGLNGTNGTNGTDGLNGTNGTNGDNGIDGLNGTNGTNGVDGLNGTNGTDGTNGTELFTEVNQTQFDNSTGVLNIRENTWYTPLWDLILSLRTTDNLTEGSINLYDNQSWNQGLADTLYAVIGWNPFNQDLNTTSNVTFANITADYYFGNGSQLTGIVTVGDNESWNQTFADTLYMDINEVTGNESWNQTFADTLYADISVVTDNSSWNQSFATTLYADISLVGDNESWNQTLADTIYEPKSTSGQMVMKFVNGKFYMKVS